MKKLGLVVLLLLLAVAVQADEFTPETFANLPPVAAPTLDVPQLTVKETPDAPWWSGHEIRWAAFKSASDLTSIGAGPSLQLWKLTATNSAWLDLAAFWNDQSDTLGWFAGLSTEIEGIPLLGQLLAPVIALSGDTLSRAGVGYSHGVVYYVTVDF